MKAQQAATGEWREFRNSVPNQNKNCFWILEPAQGSASSVELLKAALSKLEGLKKKHVEIVSEQMVLNYLGIKNPKNLRRGMGVDIPAKIFIFPKKASRRDITSLLCSLPTWLKNIEEEKKENFIILTRVENHQTEFKKAGFTALSFSNGEVLISI